MSVFNRKQKAYPAAIIEMDPGKPKKRGIGKPFEKGFDPRRNMNGKPKTGESLAEHIRQLLDSPMKRSGTEEETSVLDAGLIALANAFIAGDPAVSKLLLDRGFGKLPESIVLSKLDRGEEDENRIIAALSDDEKAFYFWVIEWVQWCATGRVLERRGPFQAHTPSIVHRAIQETHIMQIIANQITKEKQDGNSTPATAKETEADNDTN